MVMYTVFPSRSEETILRMVHRYMADVSNGTMYNHFFSNWEERMFSEKEFGIIYSTK